MSTPNPTTSGKMTINLPGVIKTLGESLYSDPSVSLRELVQNANDTCIVRQVDDPQSPPGEIHIKFDSWKKLLIVEDNGAGMTEEEVQDFLTVIGSSNTDKVRSRLEAMGEGDMSQRLIGRFGLGLLSAFIIGERVEFVTRSYKEGAEAIWWECDGGQEYRMGPAAEGHAVGTTVTIFVSPKHVGMLRDDKLKELIHLYADLLQIPIYLDPLPNPINVMSAPWDREATEQEYRQFVAERYPDDAILDVIPLEISEDEGKFKVGGVLFVPKQPYFIVREHGDATVYVRRMFVSKHERTLLPEWAKFVKGIVSSPNLRETTSREAILKDENFERVQKALGKAILDYLARVSNENPRLFKEIVTNHNLVIKAWAIASDELFDRIKDIVLFQTDAGMINIQRYFEMSRYSKASGEPNDDKRYIFYFTTAGGVGQHAVLFAAKGLRVIDASQFPDDGFLQKYADRHDDVVAKRLDVSGGFIFEELERRERKWAELEEVYGLHRIDAKVVRFVPEDIPAVLIYPEAEPVTDQVEGLINDPKLSPALKSLVRQMWEDREKQRKGMVSGGGVLYVNAISPIVKKLVDLDVAGDYETQDVMLAIYHNALMLSAQGSRMVITPESAKRVFDGNNRAIAALMNKIYEVRDLKAKQLVLVETAEMGASTAASATPAIPSAHSAIEQTEHVTCFVALPFAPEYDVVLEALRDVLEVSPYFWEVVRADKRFFAQDVPNNVAQWIARAHCYAVDLSEGNENVMMELGQIYWGYPERPLFLLQREGTERRLTDLGGYLRITYPWSESVSPNRKQMADTLRTEIKKFDNIKKLKGKAHYLSARAMQIDWIPSKLSQTLAEHYTTVEELLAQDAQNIADKIGHRVAPPGVIQSTQDYMREQCGLPRP